MPGKEQHRWLEALKPAPEKAIVKFREFIENSTHRDRAGAMLELGRMSLSNGTESQKARLIIAEFFKSDFADRFLALLSCHGSRDSARILAMTSDRSETLRAIARRMLTIYGTDDHVFQCFQQSAIVTRKSFLKALSKGKRFAVVDRILQSLETTDRSDFTALLPYGSLEFVNKHWLQIESDCSSIEWERLTRNKPAYAKQRIIELVRTTPEYDSRVRWLAVSVLRLLSKAGVEGTMDLFNELLRICTLQQISLMETLRAFPVEMSRICAEREELIALDFSRIYRRLDEDLVVTLMKKNPMPWGIAQILKKLPVVTRAKLYEQLAPKWRQQEDGVMDDAILEQMPRNIREKEARIHLAMETLSGLPQLRLKYASFLPWNEAKQLLSAPLTDPDPELRAVAWSALLGALRFNRNEIGDALGEIKKRKKEQDPIRQAIFEALAKLPPIIWTKECLNELATIIQDALDSRDLSYGTSLAVETVLLSLVPFYPAWSADKLAHFWRQRGSGASYRCMWRINDKQAIEIESKIIDVLRQWRKKDYELFIVMAAGLFKKRLKVTKQITALLRELVLGAVTPYNAQSAFNVIRAFAFDELDQLVPEMLKKDKSWGMRNDVVNYLHKYRQDLLTPYLGQHVHTGRFYTGSNRVVPALNGGMPLLSSRQLAIYTDNLSSMITDKTNRRHENFFAINNLAKIPNCPVKYFSAFKQFPAEYQMALFALSRLDEGQGVPLLVEALRDPESAWVAIYALRKCLIKMTAHEAFLILKKAPRKQVTVEKEIVRLLGDIKSDEAFGELCAIANQQDLHRDVRVATLRAVWNHLEKDESWKLLMAAVNSEEEPVAFTAIRTPAERLSQDGQRKLVSLLLIGMEHPTIRVRLKTLERLSTMPVPDPQLELLGVTIRSLNSDNTVECSAAAQALVELYSHKALTAFPVAATEVMGKRRNIQVLIEHMVQGVWQYHVRMMPATYATLTALEADPLTLTLRVRLAVAAMPWPDLAEWFKELESNNSLHPDLLHDIGQFFLQSKRFDIEDLIEIENELSSSSSELMRRIALYALQALASHKGWTEELLSRLEAFRTDRSRFIAEVAQFTFPADEELLKTARALSQ